MLSGCVGLRRPRLRAVAGLIGVVAVAATIASSPAEARKRRHAGGGGSTPPYAAMVVDAKTGRTLHAVNEDAARIPASLTKVMTLYMLFEQMERGRFTMDSELKVSSYAASQPPTKLGLRAGSTISVEDAIKSMVNVKLDENNSITHDVTGKYTGASVLLKKSPEGTGIIAGGPARSVCEIAGIQNIRTKSLGSNNKQNVVLATIEALKQLRSPEDVAKLRGKSVEEILG